MSYTSPSPPPLRHPVPTHPAYIPEPPSAPASPQGYQRFSSSPQPQQVPHQQYSHIPPTHVPAYTSPFQHQQHQHIPPQIPPQQHPNSMVPPPDFAAWGMSNPTAQLSMQIGQSAVAAGQDYVQKNFGGFFPVAHVKRHFNVSNSYVMRKLKVVLFPWMHKPWGRKIRRSDQGQSEWQSPREDLNSPDLYIPLMAMVTYILLSALHSGLQDRFHPQVLGQSASTALVVLGFDLFFVKLGCYLLSVEGSAQVVDLIAYGGYKFVGVIPTLICGFLTTGRTLWTLVFIYFFLANAFFLLRSLRSVVLPDPSSIPQNPNQTASISTATATSSQRRRRITFLFLEAVSQVFWMAILTRV